MIAVFLASIHLNAQTKKVSSVYLNFPSKAGISYMNPLELGIKLRTKNEVSKIVLGLNTYFNRNNESSYFDYEENIYLGDFYSVNNGDTTSFYRRGVSNQGIGFSTGFSRNFSLRKFKLQSTVTLNNIINIKRRYTSEGEFLVTQAPTTGGGGVPIYYFKETYLNEEYVPSYVPVLTGQIGASFTMGNHLELVPKLNSSISVNNMSSAGFSSPGLGLDISIRPSIAIGYKF